ncbi:coiled-coil and C2 domain-containing protein 2A [Planoprotostelium fungivorum]|uniref:Coiled-coil and C2 domain-containing protein 2A n=1 Tax=Planoprotostelium fungivorum TaxID=1890364 RepID=A0A2P6NTJ7_9EUKA|nr:coiled-coil and C2 domain-containing protein 2A [Planoprotostelium fungivorum]
MEETGSQRGDEETEEEKRVKNFNSRQQRRVTIPEEEDTATDDDALDAEEKRRKERLRKQASFRKREDDRKKRIAEDPNRPKTRLKSASDEEGDNLIDEINHYVELHQRRHGGKMPKLKRKKDEDPREADLEKGEGGITEDERRDLVDEEEEEYEPLDPDQMDPQRTAFVWTERSPVILPSGGILESEQVILTHFSDEAPKLQNDDGSEFRPRYYNLDGFFVGKKPPVAASTQYKMENRLYEDAGTMWFGSDGRMDNQIYPIKHKPERSSLYHDPQAISTETRFVDPVLPSNAAGLALSVKERYFSLEVDFQEMRLWNHPLFTTENVLASKLETLYLEWLERKTMDLTKFYNGHLEAMEEALERLKENPPPSVRKDIQTRLKSSQPQSPNPAHSAHTTYQHQLKKLRASIRQTRIMRDDEESRDLRVLQKMISTYKQLRSQRQRQGFTSTNVKLMVRKENVDEQEDWKRIEKQMDAEIRELKEDDAANFAMDLEEYRRKLHEWEQEVKMGEEARDRAEAARTRRAGGQDHSDDDEEMKTLQDQSRERPTEDEELDKIMERRPQLPQQRPFDDEEAKVEIWNRYKKTKRTPGTPIQTPKIIYNETITPDNGCSLQEQTRRQEIGRTSAFFRISVNGRYVAKTKPRPLDVSFDVQFREFFTLQVLKWPDSICVQLCTMVTPVETGILSQKSNKENILAETELKLSVSTEVKISRIEYLLNGNVSFIPVYYDAQEIGSPREDGHIEASIFVATAWSTDESGAAIIPPLRPEQKQSLQEKNHFLRSAESIRRLKEWFVQQGIDPNNPRNAHLMHLLKRGDVEDGDASNQAKSCSLLHDHVDMHMTLRPNYEHKRRRMLRNRQRLGADIKVQLLDHLITQENIDQLENRKSHDPQPAQKEAQSQRAFLREVRAYQATTVKGDVDRRRKKMQLYRDILNPLPLVKFDIWEILGSIFRPRRALKPTRKPRQYVVDNSDIKECQLLTQIVRAYNVPHRTDDANDVEALDDQVCPYVQVTFQGQQHRTRVAQGVNAQWNETLQFDFHPPGDDFSSNNLLETSETIWIDLFDEVMVNIHFEGENTNEVHQRRERRWLGSCSLPFSAVYANGKVEGNLWIKKPIFSLSHSSDTSRKFHDMGIINIRETTLSIYFTLDPALGKPPPDVDEDYVENPSIEERETLKRVTNWMAMSKLSHPNRNLRQILPQNLDGQTALALRYISPLAPPPSILEMEGLTEEVKIRATVRFVSLIPFLEDSVTFVGKTNVWEFLEMKAGDEEEHAVLLCNYFLYFELDAYVVVGHSAEGSSACVLVRSVEGTPSLWNPITGDQYSVDVLWCPLKSVYMIFNDKNAWANTQESESPWKLDWDLSGEGWRPLFDANLQPENLPYRQTPDEFVEDLTSDINSALSDMIKMSGRFVTRWQRACSKALQEVLDRCEAVYLGLDHFTNDEIRDVISKFTNLYDIVGFPIQTNYTDIEELVQIVEKTGIHLTDNERAEFALAVHVFPYPNRVCAIWLSRDERQITVLWWALFFATMTATVEAKVTIETISTSSSWVFLDKFCFDSSGGRLNFGIIPTANTILPPNATIAFFSDGAFRWQAVYKSNAPCSYKLSASNANFPAGVFLNNSVPFGVAGEIPHWWYVVLANCDGDEVDFKFNMTSLNAGSQAQFSYDEQGVYQMGLAFSGYFAFIMLCEIITLIRCYQRRMHTTLIWFIATAIFYHLLCAAFYAIHYTKYQSDGIGYYGLSQAAIGMQMTSQIIVLVIIILLSKGYPVSTNHVEQKRLIVAIVFAYFASYLGLFVWFQVGVDPALVLFLYDSVPGLVICILNLIFAAWVGREIYRTVYYENNYVKKSMYGLFAIAAIGWLLILPLVTLIAHFSPDYNRQRIVTAVLFTLFAVEFSFLFIIFSPFRYNKFFAALDPDETVEFGTNKSQIFPE